MKLISYLSAFILVSTMALSPTASAQTFKQMQKEAHKSQLANAKSSIDKNAVKNFIEKEIIAREEETMNNLPTGETLALLNDLMTEAKTHLGKKYRSGGKGPSSFDCSGFSSYVYNQFGIKLGASSRDQFKQGETVENDDLRIGDLVFFTGRNSSRGVGHVGIVVEADNEHGTFKFIHAAIKGGIKIDSNTGYYEGRYLGARRVISE